MGSCNLFSLSYLLVRLIYSKLLSKSLCMQFNVCGPLSRDNGFTRVVYYKTRYTYLNNSPDPKNSRSSSRGGSGTDKILTYIIDI